MLKKHTPQSHDLLYEFFLWLKAFVVSGLIIGILMFIFWIIPEPYYTEGFRNLSELKAYAATLDEVVKIEGKSVFFLRYEPYYQKHFGPSIWNTTKEKFDTFATFLHLKNKPIFSPSFFKKLLEDVNTYRKEQNWSGDFIQKIDLTENSRVVVFGAVQGALHGLVRYLDKLTELNIINEEFKIQSPNDYFVFLGNVIGRSPYTLEIFSIVLRLLQQNPQNIIYLKGSQEDPNSWQQNTLHRELELRLNRYSNTKPPLKNELNNFFNTLPLTLYCTMPFLDSAKLNYFKCAAFITDEKYFKLIDAPRYATFLRQKSTQQLATFDLSQGRDNDPEANNVESKAIIRDIKKRESYEPMDGLRRLPQTKGIITWTVLSSAAETSQIFLKFFYDAFTIIEANTHLADWRINLYNRDIRNKNDLTFKKKSFQFFTGKPLDITENLK